MKGLPTCVARWLRDALRPSRTRRRPARQARRTLLHPELLEARDVPSALGVSPHHHAPRPAPEGGHVARASDPAPHPAYHAPGVGSLAAGPARETTLLHPALDDVAKAVAQARVARALPPDGGDETHPRERAHAQGLKFDEAKFLKLYQSWRSGFGERLTRSQRAGVRQLLGLIAKDPAVRDVRRVAYMLATVKHETANTWRAIEEYGCNPRTGCTPIPGNSRSYGDPDPVTGKTYYGRGYVQLTHKSNYARMNTVLRRVYHMHVDIVRHPELVLRPTIAYRIMSYGMRHGSFTGKKLGDFIRPGRRADYYHAREIINGLDRAGTIAGYAQKLEGILRHSRTR
jgi:predicted chitinase